MAKVDKEAEKPGSVRSAHLEGKILETIYEGYITVAMVAEVNAALAHFLSTNPRGDWLINALDATGIAPAPHDLRMKVFETFKAGGGSRIAAVVRSSTLRMLATTFAFGFRLPMKSFDTRPEALAYLRAGATD